MKELTTDGARFNGALMAGPTELEAARACLVGIPFDCGTHPTRIGARQGPDAIRQQSPLLRQYRNDVHPGPRNPLGALGLVDLGNVRCTPGDVDASFPNIEAVIDHVVRQGKVPITMGGDGAVTLPQLRAVGKHYPGLAVIHIDAHTDTYPVPGINTATTFTRAAEEGLLDTSASVHLGARGTTFMDGVFEFTRQVGYSMMPFSEFQPNRVAVIDALKEKLGQRPVYLCFDMDIFDPSCAPGVCTPEWGGLSAAEGLALLRQLSGLNIVACDVNTVSPPQDIGGMTAFLAANVVYEFCALVAAALPPTHS